MHEEGKGNLLRSGLRFHQSENTSRRGYFIQNIYENEEQFWRILKFKQYQGRFESILLFGFAIELFKQPNFDHKTNIQSKNFFLVVIIVVGMEWWEIQVLIII